jgi:HSP20 family molecular chaperone IbpA
MKEGVMKSSKVSPLTAEPPSTLLQPRDPEKMRWDMQAPQLAITRRAFELFEKRNREHGHDWEDWFQAESELLRPVSIATLESADRLSLRANVLGFGEQELSVSIEPKRVVILGKKGVVLTETNAVDWYPDQIMRVIDLPTEVDPDGAVVELQTGLLKFELPKVVKTAKKTAPAAA